MKNIVKFSLAASAALMASAFTLPTAQAAPNIPCKTAKLIVPWGAGGGTHVLFSIYEKTIQELDVTPKVKVIAMGGQGGNKGAKEAAKSKPDGCTLFAIHQSAITSYLNGRIDFHYNGFDTVSLLTSTPDIVGASATMPWKNFADMKKDVLAAPGKYTVGATMGSTSQFYWLVLEAKTGMKFKFVPYDGTAQRTHALLSGAIDLGGINVAANRKHIQAEVVKAFGIAGAKRSPHLPNLPTLKELGVDMVYALDRGIVAPKGTPKDVIDHWAGIFKQASENKNLLAQMDAKGTDINWVGPEDFRKWADQTYAEHEKIAVEIGMWKK